MPDERCAVDTNILLSGVRADTQDHITREAVKRLAERGLTLCYTAQNIVEFWNVCTRPQQNNGLGLTPEQVEEEVKVIESTFLLLPESPLIYGE